MEIINKYNRLSGATYGKEELTFEQYKSNLAEFKEGAQGELLESLNSKTVKVLKNILAQLRGWTRGTKKADIIKEIIDAMQGRFLLGRPVSWTWGSGTYKEAEEKAYNQIDKAIFDKFNQDRKEEREKKAKALSDPQTIDEFITFCQEKGIEALSTEQLERYERLRADNTLKHQEKEEERKAEVTKVEIEGLDLELYQTKHSKTGADIYTVLMSSRVDKPTFAELRTKAKKMGGYYSRYTDRNANPPIKAGFNFDTEKEAVLFMGLKDSNQTTIEAKQEHKEEKKQSASERMRESANAKIDKNQAILNQPRQTNTHRRIAQAQSTEDKANREIQFAKKMLKIADGLEDGSIKYLHALRNGKQLEQLEQILRMGFNERIKSLNLSYREREQEEPNPSEDVNFTKYPFPSYWSEHIENTFLRYNDTEGMKQGVKKILDYTKRNKDERGYLILTGSYTIELFKNIGLKISDKWERERILNPIQDYERIQKMGLVNVPILKTALRELIELGKGTGLTQAQKDAIELQALERSFVTKRIDGFFPTPQPLIETMFEMAKVFEGETILEPSAGLGHIAHAIKDKYPNNKLNLIECNYSLAEVLERKGFNTERNDFLQTSKKYDVIFMNPPFEKGQDIEHLKHAFSLLNDGGRLVCIMAGNKDNKADFNDFVDKYGYSIKNPEGSFKSAFRSTGVNTITVYLEKERTEEPQEVEKVEPPKEEKIGELIQATLF